MLSKSGYLIISILTISILSSFFYDGSEPSTAPVIEPYNPEKPVGMYLIPGGNFIEFRKYKSNKVNLSHELDSFYMSQEVNVAEYNAYLEIIKNDSGMIAYKQALPDYEAFRPEHIHINKSVKISAEEYFTSPEFAMYPMVCINWYQARAFCEWKTSMENMIRRSMQTELLDSKTAYRLPTQVEWEYAAHIELLSEKGNHYGKPMITETLNGSPNNYGLIHLLDNAGEWTSSPFTPLNWCNPDTYSESQESGMKVIKEAYAVGKGEPFEAEDANSSRVWLGFRYVRGI